MKIYLDPPLDAFKIKMKARVDSEAEHWRLKYITPGDGQALVYLMKVQEAQSYLRDPMTLAPHVQREATARDMTIMATAQLIVSAAVRWKEISAEIEAARMAAKIAIDNATTVDGARRASFVDWDTLLAPYTP